MKVKELIKELGKIKNQDQTIGLVSKDFVFKREIMILEMYLKKNNKITDIDNKNKRILILDFLEDF